LRAGDLKSEWSSGTGLAWMVKGFSLMRESQCESWEV
jgi:hypothetical protein